MSAFVRFCVAVLLILFGAFALLKILQYFLGLALFIAVPILALVGLATVIWLAVRIFAATSDDAARPRSKKKAAKLGSPPVAVRDALKDLERQRKNLEL
jgi:amino acid transporter